MIALQSSISLSGSACSRPWPLVAASSRPVALTRLQPVSSLDIVPDDAAFYSAMLRNREQFDTIAKSKAWAKIQALPGYQMGMGLYQMQAANPGSPVGYLEAAMSSPNRAKSLDFLADIFSFEILRFMAARASTNSLNSIRSVYFERADVEHGRSGI